MAESMRTDHRLVERHCVESAAGKPTLDIVNLNGKRSSVCNAPKAVAKSEPSRLLRPENENLDTIGLFLYSDP